MILMTYVCVRVVYEILEMLMIRSNECILRTWQMQTQIMFLPLSGGVHDRIKINLIITVGNLASLELQINMLHYLELSLNTSLPLMYVNKTETINYVHARLRLYASFTFAQHFL